MGRAHQILTSTLLGRRLRAQSVTTVGLLLTLLPTCAKPDRHDDIGLQSAAVVAAPTLTVSAGTTSFIGPSSPVVVDPNLTLTFPGGGNLTGARVSISAGYVSTQDVLAFTNQNGITGTWSSSTGILTLTGTAAADVYQTALRTVTYRNTAAPNPDTRARQVTFSIGANSLYSPDTGHYYEFVTQSGIAWASAKTAAEARNFYGLQGYLVTVTSSLENTFVASKLAGQGWMGASDAAAERTWRWVTGPEGLENSGAGRIFFTQTSSDGSSCPSGPRGVAVNGEYNRWANCEPNDYAGDEDYAHFYVDGTWNDYKYNNASIAGYVVEYGGMPNDPTLQVSGSKALSVQAGCNADSQCTSNQYCDKNALTCRSKLAAGVAIPNDGLHGGTCSASSASAVCVSAQCNSATNTCATANGTACATANQCVANVCGSNNLCGASNGTSGCTPATASAFCQSGACTSSGTCVPSGPGRCYVDNDCTQGFFCRRDTFTCTATLNPGVAIPDDGLHGGTCSNSVAAAVCSTALCNGATNTCASALGANCSAATGCVANLCGTNGKCGYADGTGSCSSATAATVCQSGTCSVASVCIPGGAGRCWVDGDCASDQFCNRATTTCSTKLGSGTSVPNDGLHDGTCAAAPAVCASGLCNTTSVTCAASQGGTCSGNSSCLSNVCGSNGKCGIATGDGPCTPGQVDPACQTGNCSTAGVCAPGMGGCWVDADCASGQFCDAVELVCRGKLAAGEALPTDRLHDGTCTTALAGAVCTDAACNATTNTCGKGAGSSCTSAAQCALNVCNSAGACGFGLGEGDCTPANAQVRCASGVCSSSGVCLSAVSGGCWVDADCSSSQFCNRNTFSCTARLTAGTPLPTDAIHDGACAPALAAAVCTTGACNASSQTCSGSVGADCTANAQCTNDICGSNGKCGLVTGAGPCTAGSASEVCQSGSCGPKSNLCIPADTGGCGTDADCDDGQYCSGSTLHCTARLPDGSALPADGIHATCGAGLSTACVSGLCNAAANTCGSPNGTACSSASSCATNVCGRNGKCGLDSGQSGCTAVTASLCQSGVCSGAGVCGADGCATDADCGQSGYCDATVGLCKARLSLGQKLPTDALHDGTCTAALAGAVCVSGACNAVTKECAAPKGTTCSANDQCATNVCGSNGKCGIADGQAGCTATSAAELCQSGVCSPTGSACVPTGQFRCAVDPDCASGTYCNRLTLTCEPKLGAGAPIPADGLHDGGCLPGNAEAVCVSGLCNDVAKTCAGPSGVACSDNAECANNICGSNGNCGLVDGAGPCSGTNGADVCQSGSCNEKLGVCRPTASGSCLEDADCAAGTYCNGSTLTCVAQLVPGTALPTDPLHDGTCTTKNATAVCTTALCNEVAQTCAAPLSGTCATAAECANNICGSNGKCGVADGSGPCTGSNAATACQSGACNETLALCRPTAPGSCLVDADCAAGSYCNRATLTCTAKVTTGGMLPTDGLHDGTCTVETAAAVCDTGLCNEVTKTCGGPLGAPCQAASVCANNVCGANGKCGLADGTGPCTAANATVICQSGACNDALAQCRPTAPGSCLVDADCAAGTYCNRTDMTCVVKVNPGAMVPEDGLHDAGCTAATAATVCATGLCNEVTKTCAAGNGAACQNASECASNACGSNGKCGLADGAGPCTAANGAALCQSGMCNAALGVCKPAAAGSCLQDSDCGSGTYCARATLRCVAKLPAGSAIPSDGLHSGVCSAAAAAAVCATGLCNPATNTCAAGNGAACASAAMCAVGICSEGLCGAADGATCARALECRSGACTAGICGAGPDGGVAPPPAPNGNTIGGSGGCNAGGSGVLDGAPLMLVLLGGRWLRRRRQRV